MDCLEGRLGWNKAHEPRRALSDLSSAAGNKQGQHGLPSACEAQKRALPEPRTPARRSKSFAVFDDAADMGMPSRSVASPPQCHTRTNGLGLRPTGSGMLEVGCARSAPYASGARGALSLEELLPESLPDVQGFTDPQRARDAWDSMAAEGPDGFGTVEEHAARLVRGAEQIFLQDQMRQRIRSGPIDPHGDSDCSFSSPGEAMTPGTLAWSLSALSPQRDEECFALSADAVPRYSLPALSSIPLLDMDVDSDFDT